jgi:5'-nucleotidase
MVTAALLASRGFSIDQPLCTLAQDLPNTFPDIVASTPLSNLITDAFRKATEAEIGFSVNGTARAGLTRGKSGVQTVYDVYAVAPLGAGVVDPTAGSTLVTGWFTATELKNILEFFLVDSPAHPGEYFPRASGMRFRYDPTRPKFDVVTAIELGDLDRGYSAIDISRKNERLYSLTCSLYVGMFLVSIPKLSKGQLPVAPKNKAGRPLTSKVDALDTPRVSTPDVLPPSGALDSNSIVTRAKGGAVQEIKEWEAIMDYLRSFPAASPDGLPTIVTDARALEVRAIAQV